MSTLVEENSLDKEAKDTESFQMNQSSKIQPFSNCSSITLEGSSKSDQTCTLSKQDEKRLVKALDLRIMPLFCLFYFADFLDRANIGNATLAGLQEDLKMSSAELSTAISAFFITYIIFEVPSNYILKKTNAAKWLSFIMLVWGIATLLTAFVQDFRGLIVARLVLGAAESGYIPGIMYLLSKIYKPEEYSFRVGLLIAMATLSGLVSGPLTYAMSYFDGKNGLNDWQYLYIFEGVPTILLSFVSYLFLFDDLQDVCWLSTEQKQLQLKRMSVDQQEDTGSDSKASILAFEKVFRDWKTWAFSFVCLLNSINVTSITVFAPILIDGFGFSHLNSQLLTAPPCAVATLTVLVGGYLSGKYSKRSLLLSTGSVTMAIGYLCLLLFNDKWALYGALFIIPAGAGLQAAAAIGWSAVNYSDLTVRAIAVAFVLTVAFAVIFNMITALLSALLSALVGFLLYRENLRMDQNPTNYVCFIATAIDFLIYSNCFILLE
ncbi:major facilitator superfamily domain-containing protein [Blakeslea trispora]|nr:major facilitator superfamily domain-containing protein [Blakeslea trispora]